MESNSFWKRKNSEFQVLESNVRCSVRNRTLATAAFEDPFEDPLCRILIRLKFGERERERALLFIGLLFTGCASTGPASPLESRTD